MFCKVPVWLLTTIVLLGLPVVSVFATDDSLFVPVMGARSQGMGGTGVASTYDLSPAFNNPALLAFSSPWSTAFNFRFPSSRVQGVSLYTNGEYPRKVYAWGLGLDVVKASLRTWPGRSVTGSNWRVQGTMAVARRVYDELAVGIALKPARWRLYRERSGSFEADLGLAYPTRWRDVDIVAGAVVRDLLGANVTRFDHDTTLDVSALLGVAGHYFTKDSLWEFSMGIDLEAIKRDFVDDPQGRFRIGGEAIWHRFAAYRLAGRMGYDGEHFTFGLGFDWRFLSVDWAKTAWTTWGHGQNLTVSIDPLGAREFLYDVFGESGPDVNWRDSLRVYRLEQFTHFDSSANATFDAAQDNTTRVDEARILYHNARIFADDDDQIARSDSGIARSEEVLEGWESAADSIVRANRLGGLLEAERRLTDSYHRELLIRADTCFRHREYVCALELIDMVLGEDPTNDRALRLKSDVEQERKTEIVSRRAPADSTSLDDIKGDSAIYALYEEGLAFNSSQQYQKAIEAFNKVLQKYPNSPAVIKERDQALLMLQ